VAVRFFFFTEWIQGIPQGYVVSATLNAPLALPFHFVFLPFLPTDKITPTFLHPVLLITNYSLRVALGIVIMADVLDRVSDLRAHYSDEGYVPRVLTIKHFWITGYIRYSRNYSDPYFFFFCLYLELSAHFSLHMVNGSVNFAAVMFALQVHSLRNQ
jgi:hypothetical protein